MTRSPRTAGTSAGAAASLGPRAPKYAPCRLRPLAPGQACRPPPAAKLDHGSDQGMLRRPSGHAPRHLVQTATLKRNPPVVPRRSSKSWSTVVGHAGIVRTFASPEKAVMASCLGCSDAADSWSAAKVEVQFLLSARSGERRALCGRVWASPPFQVVGSFQLAGARKNH